MATGAIDAGERTQLPRFTKGDDEEDPFGRDLRGHLCALGIEGPALCSGKRLLVAAYFLHRAAEPLLVLNLLRVHFSSTWVPCVLIGTK